MWRPPRKVENVPSACRTSIPAARDRARGKERRVRCSGCVEKAACTRKMCAEMILDVPLHSVEMVARLNGAHVIERGYQRRVLANVGAPERQNVILEFWDSSIILKVDGPVRIAIGRASDGVGETLQVDAVRADFKVVVGRGSLPSHAPVRSNAANIEHIIRPLVWLRLADMLGTINCSHQIQMIVPHRISTEPCDILGQTTVDNCGRGGRWSKIIRYEGVSPRGSAIP